MLGVATGMQTEARLLRDSGCRVICGGGRADATRQKVEQLVQSGVSGLISFGIAGALAPHLKTGDLVIGTLVVDRAGRQWGCYDPWVSALKAMLPAASTGPILGSGSLVSEPQEKAALFNITGALAVDMESQHVAAIAAQNNLPFIVLRAVMDEAQEVLPRGLSEALDDEGRTRIGLVLRAVFTGQIGPLRLAKLARQSNKALRALLGSRSAIAALGR